MDKETYRFMYPSGIASFSFSFSDHAMQWLCGTTTDDNGRDISNFTLFGDLLARMAIVAGESKGFPQDTHAFHWSGTVFRGTTFIAMGHGQEAHTQPACHAYGYGAYRHLPFKGCISDDISVPFEMGNSGKRHRNKPFYSLRTEERIRAVRSRADSGIVQTTPPVVPLSGISTGTSLYWLWQAEGWIGMER